MTIPASKKRDWSSLLFKIAGHLLDAINYVRYRAVCTFWRASSPKIPLIIIRNLDASGHLSSLTFYDLVLNQTTPLSDTAANVVSSLVSLKYDYIGSSHGWISFAVKQKKPLISLLNPFTSEQVTLPEMHKVKVSRIKTLRVVLSLPVVVFYSPDLREVSFIRVGECEWKRIKLDKPFLDVMGFKGQFYGHYNKGKKKDKLYLIDLEANNGNDAIVPIKLVLPGILSGEELTWKFLVEFSGDLLVAFSCPKRGHTCEFLKVDFENGLLQFIPGFGGHVLFLGESLPVLVPQERLLDFSPDRCHFTENPNALSVSYNRLGRILLLKGKGKDRGQHRVAAGWITPVLN